MIRSYATRPIVALALAAGFVTSAAADPPDAPTVMEYKIRHAQYGDIGTYTNVIRTTGNEVEVQSTLRIAVKLLGLTLYREEGERRERWRGNRLVSFHGTTDKNGERLAVTGEARGDVFVVTGPWGTGEAPLDVQPSNPWSARMLNATTMMSTTTGKLFPARVHGGEEELITFFDGKPQRLRQFEIFSDKREFVWLDQRDIPVAFGTEDGGVRVEFVLTRAFHGDGAPAVRIDKLPPGSTAPTYVAAD